MVSRKFIGNQLLLIPPYTNPASSDTVAQALADKGFALLPANDVADLSGCTATSLEALRASWHKLAPDTYLKDGGKYRKRRHASYVIGGPSDTATEVTLAPHRPHWQPVEYNALHGGMQRWFEPIAPSTQTPAWNSLLLWMAQLANKLRAKQTWYAEAHQFRIDTEGGIGRPTPEGAHRDGVDLVAVFLIAREAVKGGETRVFDAHGPTGVRFTLTQPWSVLLLDDAKVVHETTPIQPTSENAFRDTLVITLRSGGFQSEML
jgi:hypothetical protein